MTDMRCKIYTNQLYAFFVGIWSVKKMNREYILTFAQGTIIIILYEFALALGFNTALTVVEIILLVVSLHLGQYVCCVVIREGMGDFI